MSSNQTVDPLDGLLDFSEYDNLSSYQSPSLSPATTSKNGFTARPTSTAVTPTITTTQTLSGPSHQYDLYKQQTGIVPGALASTLAVSQNNALTGYNPLGLDYLGLSPSEDLFDFNSGPSQGSLGMSDLEMEFDSPTSEPFMFDTTINPTALGNQESPTLPSPPVLATQAPPRVWPGMHSQAALAKAQAQQRQQQQIIQQQRGTQMNKPRAKSNQPADPIVEQKITQLLNSMRAKPASPDDDMASPLMNVSRPRKDEDDMDEDERLLASEEGKKLTSKERRQLRNKVSARAFRSRRKEYITQLEAEISTKVNENGDLRAQNRALMEENKRLSDLTRMLLSSSSFSNFLDHLSTTPIQPTPAPVKAEPATQQSERRQLPKDVNPYTAGQQVQQHQIGMAMIPEQTMDFSMLTLDNDSFNFQPQVFAVLETPGMPTEINTEMLSGKSSNFVGEQLDSDNEKVELPAIERAMEKTLAPEPREELPYNEEFESNPEFSLFHSSPASESAAPSEDDTESISPIDIFGGIEPEKVLARYELLDASEEEKNAVLAMAKVQRLSDRLEATLRRIENLTFDE